MIPIPRIGLRVLFCERPGVIRDVWITSVWSDGRANLREHRTAQPNRDFRRVAFSEGLRAGCWSFREEKRS